MTVRLLVASAYLFVALQQMRADIEFYPPNPLADIEDRFDAVIEGSYHAVERYRNAVPGYAGSMEIGSVRFAANGPVRMELRFRQATPKDVRLRGLLTDFAIQSAGNTLSFTLPGPGNYYLPVGDWARPNFAYAVVLWVDDLSALNRTRIGRWDKGVVDVTARGVTSDWTKNQKPQLQRLLDEGGTLYFPPGVYRSGSLKIGSDTTLYLAPGAVLKAVDEDKELGPEFLLIENAHNVRLAGLGIVDANGGVARGHNVHIIDVVASYDVVLEDMIFQNSISWAVHIRRSHDVTARRVKVISGKDGFDPDSAQSVLIAESFVVSIDDGVAVKNRYPNDEGGRVTERIVVRDSIFSSTKSALKIGTETRGPIRDVLFENCEVFNGDRGIVLYAQDGGPVERIRWKHIRLSMMNWRGEKDSGRVFHLRITNRDPAKPTPTPVREVEVADIAANVIFASELSGLTDAPLNGVELRDIRLSIERPKDGKRQPLFVCSANVLLRIRGLAIDWNGNEPAWSGVAAGPCVSVE